MENKFKLLPDREADTAPLIRQLSTGEIPVDEYDWLLGLRDSDEDKDWARTVRRYEMGQMDDYNDGRYGSSSRPARGRSGDETFQFEGCIEATTAKAILIEPTVGEQVWMPRSQIVSQTDIGDGLYVFTITEWIAKKNNML